MMTIKDIAKLSGYSVTTVSRVLNNRRDVSQVAKEKIDAIVKEYNFVPNNNAKNLKQSYTNTILIIVKGRRNSLFANIIEEIERILENTDYNVNNIFIDEEENEVEEAIKANNERKAIGMLFLGANLNYFKENFKCITVPSVVVTTNACNCPQDNISSVSTDDKLGGKMAIEYLLNKGHRRVGIIGGDLANSHISVMRFEGCKMAFNERNIEVVEEVLYSKARYSFDSGYKAMKKLIKNYEDLTAVFCMSDSLAIGAIRAIIDSGKKVPEDISVIGFDGIPVAEYYVPRLTTIQQDFRVLASRSVILLLHAMELNHKSVHETIPFKILEGESVRNLE